MYSKDKVTQKNSFLREINKKDLMLLLCKIKIEVKQLYSSIDIFNFKLNFLINLLYFNKIIHVNFYFTK